MPELELNPTKARMRLLRAVADGAVTQRRDVDDVWHCFVDAIAAGGIWTMRPGGRWIRVTARIRELEHVGWVEATTSGGWSGEVSLTAKGKAVLGTLDRGVSDGVRP